MDEELKQIMSALDLSPEESKRLKEAFNKVLVTEVYSLLLEKNKEVSSLFEDLENEEVKEKFMKAISDLEHEDIQLYLQIKERSQHVLKSFIQSIYDSASPSQKEKLREIYKN